VPGLSARSVNPGAAAIKRKPAGEVVLEPLQVGAGGTVGDVTVGPDEVVRAVACPQAREVAPLSSGRRRCCSEPLLGELELVVDGAGDASFERADGVTSGVTLGAAPPVVGLTRAGQAKLGDGDAVHGGVQLPVAAPAQPVAVGPSRADRDGRHPSVHGKAGLGAEPGHPTGLSKQLGRGQRPAAGQAEQVGRQPGDPLAQLSGEPVDACRQRRDRGGQLLADGDLDRRGAPAARR
jgi:hypothetical protein